MNETMHTALVCTILLRFAIHMLSINSVDNVQHPRREVRMEFARSKTYIEYGSPTVSINVLNVYGRLLTAW